MGRLRPFGIQVRRVLRLLIVVAAAYGSAGLAMYLGRNRIVFPIRGGPGGEPARFGIPDGELVAIATDDGERLTGWLLPPTGARPARAGAMVWFHGNGETVAGLAPVLRAFRPAGAALLAVEFRGYGGSTGRPTVANAERDVEAVWRWLVSRADVDSSRVVVYGRSVGTGPAVLLAATHPVAGLILESAFTTLRGMARVHYPFFPAFLAGGGFDNLGRIALVRCPVLLIHGDGDRIIPIAMGRALAARAGDRGELHVIPGSDHNDTYDAGGEEYARRVREFVERVTAR